MWAQLLNFFLGIWLIAAPVVLDDTGPGRTNDRVVGPLVAAFGLFAVHEVLRPLRWVNVVLGLWLLVAPWIFASPLAALLNSLGVGLVVLGCALLGGAIHERFGGGWRAVWRPAASAQAPAAED